MKKVFQLLAAVAMLSLPFSLKAKTVEKGHLTIMSYNIRNGEADDGTNSWRYRYPLTAMMIDDQKPDILGLQEAFLYQANYIKEYVKPYKYVGVGRENGKKEGEIMALFYNPETVSLLKWGTFWLSDTPDKPSLGWDAACRRTATWGLFKDKRTGNKFFYVNTHLDHVGKEARSNGLKLILERIAKINKDGLPIALGGDFNVRQDDPTVEPLEGKMLSARRTALRSDNGITYNAWGKVKEQSQIDHIYYNGFSRCQEFKVITKKYENHAFISDHFPVVAELVF